MHDILKKSKLEQIAELYQVKNGAGELRDVDYDLYRDPLATRIQQKM